MGTQDSFALAEQFRSSTGISSFPLLWDPSFESWMALGVSGQPAGILTTAEGTLVAQWRGAIPEEEVLAAAAEL